MEERMRLEKGNITDSLVGWAKKYTDNIIISGYQNSSIKLYNRIIDDFIDYANGYVDEYGMRGINRLFINSYLLSKGKGLKKSTLSLHLRIIKTFFNFISDNNDEEYDFTHIFKRIRIKTPKRQKPHLNKDEILRLMNILEKEKSKRRNREYISFRNALMIKLMLYSGLRVSEAINVKYSDIITADIDPLFYKIMIIGKGNKQAPVYIKKSVVKEEFDYIKNIRRHTDLYNGNDINYVFVTNKGKQLDRINIYKMLKRLFKRADISKTGVHILRHTFAMRLVAANVDILHIQKLMRHANIQTTMVYAHSTEADSIKVLKNI